jgi:hypothetical protein
MKQAGYGSDLARLKQEEDAKNYRDSLLKADRDSVVRNKVFDLDSDYYNLETGDYLTVEERKAIQKRKDELKSIRGNRARRALVVDLDFETGKVREKNKYETYEKVEDRVIQEILKNAEERRANQRNSSYQLRPQNLPTADKFVPTVCFLNQLKGPSFQYNCQESTSQIPTADELEFTNIYADKDLEYAEVERKGFYLSVSQPEASKLMSGENWLVSLKLNSYTECLGISLIPRKSQLKARSTSLHNKLK